MGQLAGFSFAFWSPRWLGDDGVNCPEIFAQQLRQSLAFLLYYGLVNILDLNQQQIKAVQTVQGPVLVLAGPGSGKTRVLTQRIAYLIDVAGVAPWQILAVTFTNKAAKEMRERVERTLAERFGGELHPAPLPGQAPRLGGLTIGTFHSLCARILRVETAAIGFAPNWVIYDTADQLALIRSILQEMNLDERRYSPKAIQAHISVQKNELIDPQHYQSSSYFEEVAGRVYSRYQKALRINNAMDFDDLLMHTALLLREQEAIRRKYQQKWPYVLVDEFQDTNGAQYEILHLLAGAPENNRNIFSVGDEDQAIFRFRGADYRNVRRFREEFPDAVVVLLEQNYRSTQSILDVANAVIRHNRNRSPKQLHTDNGQGLTVRLHTAYNEIEEASYVCDEIQRLVGTRAFAYGDFAVLYRTNAQSRALEEGFVLRRMKYKLIGATRFYERKEIKDALGYLRLINNPADLVALDRVINTPPRGIGVKTYAELKLWTAEHGLSEYAALLMLRHGAEPGLRLLRQQMQSGLVPPQPLPGAAPSLPPLPKRALGALNDFTAQIEEWIAGVRRDAYASVADLLDQVLTTSGYLDDLRDGSQEGQDRFENLQELRGVAAQYVAGLPSSPTVNRPETTALALFLEEVSLVSDSDAVDENASAVTLMTLHTAKGLEYPVIFVVGLEEGLLPHARSIESGDPEDIEEERRLLYVGVTRAKKRLYLVNAVKRTLWGGPEAQDSSRFLDEIPPDLLSGMVNRRARREAAFQRSTRWGDDEGSGSASTRPSQPRNPYNWSSQNAGRSAQSTSSASRSSSSVNQAGRDQPVQPKAAYWSPASPDRPKPSDNKPETAQPAGRLPAFKRNDSIQHAKFGVGTVIESKLSGDDEEVTIAFPGIGVKKFLASLTTLKKL